MSHDDINVEVEDIKDLSFKEIFTPADINYKREDECFGRMRTGHARRKRKLLAQGRGRPSVRPSLPIAQHWQHREIIDAPASAVAARQFSRTRSHACSRFETTTKRMPI